MVYMYDMTQYTKTKALNFLISTGRMILEEITTFI